MSVLETASYTQGAMRGLESAPDTGLHVRPSILFHVHTLVAHWEAGTGTTFPRRPQRGEEKLLWMRELQFATGLSEEVTAPEAGSSRER